MFPSANLEIRNNGTAIIRNSAVLIFRTDGRLDVQLGVYLSDLGERNAVRFVLTTDHTPPGNTYNLLVGRIEALWLRSVVENGFEVQ